MSVENYPDAMKTGRKSRLGSHFRDNAEHSQYWLTAVFPMLATIALWRVLFPERVWLGVLAALAVGVVADLAFGAWQRRRTPDVTDPTGAGSEYDPRL